MIWIVVRLHAWLVVYGKFKFAYTTTSKIGSQLLMTSTSSNVLLEWISEKAFNECLWIKQSRPLGHVRPNWVTYHHEVASIPLGEVSLKRCSVSS